VRPKIKAHDNLCFPLRRAYLLLLCIYFYARVNSVLLYFLFIFLFCKHHVLGKDLGTYIQLDMSDHELLLLTSPLRWISWEAKSQAPIFLCVWLKLSLHIYVLSVSNHRRLNDGWVCGLAKKLLHETLPENMMNCNCIVD